MKAIIPVAGAGAKLRPHTYTQPKALMTIAGKTILSFIIDQLKEAGITDFVFIIGYLGEKIQEYVTTAYPELNCHFVQQSQRLGIGHAIWLARDIVGDEELFITLGDTVCDFDIAKVAHSEGNWLGIMKVDDPRHFGIAEMDENGAIRHMVEKPNIPKSNQALVGLYKIKDTALFFDCLSYIIKKDIKAHGEFSITDGLDLMRQKGCVFQPFRVKYWYDCGKKESLLASNAILLNRNGSSIHPSVNTEKAIIIPPVNIAAGTKLDNAVVGPNVSIGANSSLTHSVIRDSIIGSYTSLVEVVLDNSIIGSDASVRGLSRSLNIGDNTEIDFG